MHDMEMMGAAEVTGTFAGHVLPGAMFIVWALYWMAHAVLRGEGARGAPLESGLAAPLVKTVLPFVGMWVEIPGRGWPPGQGWFPHDVMMNWQHVTMYGAFLLSGVADLLVRRGTLPASASYVAFGMAALNAGFLFAGHGSHGGVPGVVHTLLVVLFFTVAALAMAEAVRPSSGLAWVRKGALLALGSWFTVVAWILYRSGWDLTDPVREGWSYMAFSWNAIVVIIVTAAAMIASRRSHAPSLLTGSR